MGVDIQKFCISTKTLMYNRTSPKIFQDFFIFLMKDKKKVVDFLDFQINNNLIGDYLKSALKSRVKLAAEVRNIRRYIDRRFEQNPNPGIVITGDCNDGPGFDYFEKKYLFF